MLRRLILSVLYVTGAFGLYHRVRNRHALTVISFHRVLAEGDARWRTCDPLYTVSDRLFEQCVHFFRAHYSIVSLDDVLAARRSERTLPPRPLLITFDDGWADNYAYALPVLQKTHSPAVLFVATDAIDRKEAFFQEQIVSAWRRGTLTTEHLRGLWMSTAQSGAVMVDPTSETSIRALISGLQRMPSGARSALLSSCASALEDVDRQMLTTEELRALAAANVAVGTHGKAHEPLTAVPDIDGELRGARTAVADILAVPLAAVTAASFPFSKFNAAVIERARASGYELLFAGGLALTPLEHGLPYVIARIGITAHEVVDPRGDLRAARLAGALFRAPHSILAQGTRA
jgi:peptidoglycan/xylan/chitin deacetylase (PgdA/CDA1 family)